MRVLAGRHRGGGGGGKEVGGGSACVGRLKATSGTAGLLNDTNGEVNGRGRVEEVVEEKSRCITNHYNST